MRKIRILIVVTFIGMVNFSLVEKSPDWETISKEEFLSGYEKAMQWFTATGNYKVDIEYASYKGHKAMVPHDRSKGSYKKDKLNFNSTSFGVKTIQNEAVQFMVDTLNKLIVLSDKAESKKSPVDSKSFSEMLNNIQSLQKKRLENGTVDYKILFKPNNLYSFCEFEISEKGVLNGLTYYYSMEVKENEEDENSAVNKPRVEITFSKYQTNVNFDYESEFSEKQYFRTEGKKFVLNEKYKTYQLKDYRTGKK